MQTQQYPEVTVHTLKGVMPTENGEVEAHVFSFYKAADNPNSFHVDLHGPSAVQRCIVFKDERGDGYRLDLLTNQAHFNRFRVEACRALYRYLVREHAFRIPDYSPHREVLHNV